MKTKFLWSKILVITGFVFFLIGTIDPLEGSPVIIFGSLLIAIGAYLYKSKYQLLLNLSFLFLVIGVGILFWLSSLGGVGEGSNLSIYWLYACLPMPIGWLTCLVVTILKFKEGFKVPVTILPS